MVEKKDVVGVRARVAQGRAGQRKLDWYDPANGPCSRAKPCNIDLQDNGDMGKPVRSMVVEGNNDKHIGRLSVLGSAKTSLEHA